MTLKPEILSVDPNVSDIAGILQGLRPEVEAILLDARRPAARQMAEALQGHQGLDAIHIIAHGSPGRVTAARRAESLRSISATQNVDLVLKNAISSGNLDMP